MTSGDPYVEVEVRLVAFLRASELFPNGVPDPLDDASAKAALVGAGTPNDVRRVVDELNLLDGSSVDDAVTVRVMRTK